MLRDRYYLWLSGLILLLSLPARFAGLSNSLWLDEAWVANSVLAPSLRDMFLSKTWAQTSPPLFLLLERWAAVFAGHSEPALRILPVAAVLTGLVLTALALRRWLSVPAALLGFTLLVGNYWVIKYGQAVKQYGTDFLVSALLLWLLGCLIESRTPRPHPAALLAVAAAGLIMSYTTAVWLPTLLIFAAIPRQPDGVPALRWSGFRWRATARAGFVLGTVLLIEYVIFIRPNRTPALIRSLHSSYLDPRHPLVSLQRLISAAGVLLASLPGLAGGLVGLSAAALAVYATVRAVREAQAGKPRGFLIVLAGALPLACLLAVGALGLYPVLDYPRMLLFALPSVAFLLAYGADALLRLVNNRPSQAFQTGWRAAVLAACLAATATSQFVYFRYPRPSEENRPAMAFIQSRLEPSDLLFVHGGMYEQLKYYRTELGFRPQQLYVGNTHWPCCATGDLREATSPASTDFANDLLEAARRAKRSRLWLVFPAGATGHWSAFFRDKIEAMPSILVRGGCTREVHKLYGQTLVESYSCH